MGEMPKIVPLSAARRDIVPPPDYADRPLPARARRYATAAIDDPELVAAMRAWQDLAGGQAFRYDRPGAAAALLRSGLLDGWATVICAELDDPLHWYFAFQNRIYNGLHGQSAMARRITDAPAPDLIARSIADYRAAIDGRAPVVSCLTGSVQRRTPAGRERFHTVGYDRIVFPMAGADGRVSRLLTVARPFVGWPPDD